MNNNIEGYKHKYNESAFIDKDKDNGYKIYHRRFLASKVKKKLVIDFNVFEDFYTKNLHTIASKDKVVNEKSVEQQASKSPYDTQLLECNLCGTTFRLQNHLDKHMLRHSFKASPFKCQVCSKVFLNSNILTDHLKQHTDHTKKFECIICNKWFKFKSQLDVHLKIHIGIKEFRCDICNKFFTYKYNLNLHLRRNTSTHKFKCHIWSKSFKQE